jgi:hypothetical protein
MAAKIPAFRKTRAGDNFRTGDPAMHVFEIEDQALDALDNLLCGMRFPASRDSIVAVAMRRGAERSLIARLHNLPPDQYERCAHVRQMLMLLTPDSARSDEGQR